MNPWLAIPTFTATLAWVGVVVWYWIRAKWWKSFVGQNTMGISFFLAIALLRLSYTHLDSTPPTGAPFWLTLFGMVIYAGLTFFGGQRIFLIENAQRSKKPLLGNIPMRRWDDPK